MIDPLVVADVLLVATLVTARMTAVARRLKIGTNGLGITTGCLAMVAVRLGVADTETLFGGVTFALFEASIAWLWFAVQHAGRAGIGVV